MAHDSQQRELIAEYAISIAITALDSRQLQAVIKSAKSAQEFYQSQFQKYLDLKSHLTKEKHKACDFWFNDAGFQYKWRNSKSIIVLECLGWAKYCAE
jgi:hypothetical protein